MNFLLRSQKLLKYAFYSRLFITHIHFEVKLPINLQALVLYFNCNSFESWCNSVQLATVLVLKGIKRPINKSLFGASAEITL